MTIFDFLAHLKYRNYLLYRLGLIHIIFFFLFAILLVIDDRTVLGINTWIKPMKFAISISIYLWTMAWILAYLKVKKRVIQYFSWGISIAMLVEMTLIMYQAFRAVPSHFNFSTDFDAIIFGIMGMMIAFNTVLLVGVFLLFLLSKTLLTPVQLLSIRLGFIIFIVGNFVGGIMIGQGSHAVGVADGGSGIPFFNWSTEAGDLRIAHFMGLHSLQLIPLFGFYVEKNYSSLVKYHKLLVIISTLIYASIFAWLYYQAAAGLPLIY